MENVKNFMDSYAQGAAANYFHMLDCIEDTSVDGTPSSYSSIR